MQVVMRKQVFSFIAIVVLVLCMVASNAMGSRVGAQTGTEAPTSSSGTNNTNKVTCPDTTKQIITPTATQTSAALTATLAAPITDPVVLASSSLLKQTEQAEFNVQHTILDFASGITSAPYFFQGTVNLIVIQGNLTYCSGGLQRVLIPGNTWTIPAQARFTLANAGNDLARISLVALEPLATATAAVTGTVTVTTNASTPVATAGEAQTATVISAATQSGTVTAAAYLGIRAAGVDNTGVRVTQLLTNSPAGAAQVQVGDVITAIDGKPVASLLSASAAAATQAPNEVSPLVTAFFQLIAQHRPGDIIQLTILRGSQTLTITVTLGTLPSGS